MLGLPSLWLCLTLQGRKRQRHSGSVSLALKSLRTPFLLSFPTLSQSFLPLPPSMQRKPAQNPFFDSRGPSLRDLSGLCSREHCIWALMPSYPYRFLCFRVARCFSLIAWALLHSVSMHLQIRVWKQ